MWTKQDLTFKTTSRESFAHQYLNLNANLNLLLLCAFLCHFGRGEFDELLIKLHKGFSHKSPHKALHKATIRKASSGNFPVPKIFDEFQEQASRQMFSRTALEIPESSNTKKRNKKTFGLRISHRASSILQSLPNGRLMLHKSWPMKISERIFRENFLLTFLGSPMDAENSIPLGMRNTYTRSHQNVRE